MKQVLITAAATALLAGCGGSETAPTQMQPAAVSPAEQTAVSQPPDIGLQEAAVQGNVEAIRQHIAAGSDLNERDPTSGSSPLITAATFGQVEAARVLIEGGAEVNARNNEGSTPLHTAAFLCRPEIVKALLENGADKNGRNNGGATALESVAGPFDDVRPIYDLLGGALAPLGLKLDYERIKATRPKIAEMLR